MDDALATMIAQDPKYAGGLLRRASTTLGVPHGELAKVLGVSRRSVSRWASQGFYMSKDRAITLAELVHPRDRGLAAEFAGLIGKTLVSLGLEAVHAPAALPLSPALGGAHLAPPRVLAAVVCAAAEAMDASPRAVRPALLAAVRVAREVGLTLADLESLLASGASETPSSASP